MNTANSGMTRRRAVACLVGSNALVYGLNGVYSAFMPVYLSAHHSSIVKGYLLSIGSIVALVAPVLIGKIADKAGSKNRVLVGCITLAALLFSASYLSSNVWYLAAVIAMFTFFKSSFGGLVDTATLEYASANDMPYGPIRAVGTIGYGLIAFVLGIVANRKLGYAFAFYPIVSAGAVFFLLRGPQIPGHAEKREKLQVTPVLRNRNIQILFLLHGVAYFAFIYYQHYYNEYVLDILSLPTWLWGLNALITVGLEIPFFFFFDRIMRKVPLKAMLFVCLAVSVLRYLLLPTVTTATGILLTGFFTGGWVTAITYCATLYIQQHMPSGLIASCIGLLYAASAGCGTLLADFGGGYLTAWLGIRGGLFFCAALCFLSLPAVFFLRTAPKEQI